MHIRLQKDHVEISGYVNAVERESRPLWSKMGQFIEKICKGAFKSAIIRNDDVHILLNHDWHRDLGSTKQGNLELTEDSIGLHARATISDEEVVQKARNGDLIGWSFGFKDVPGGFEKRVIDGMETRIVKDLDLYEVSILDRTKSSAYEGTLIMARDDGQEMYFRGEDFIDEVQVQTIEPPNQHATAVDIDYSQAENIIKEMRGEQL